ncbi:glutamate-cysteine ligase-domain-containing protein [Umbelopsis sp. PMI_123]|nr:glutamate-cysteine ligase-domain-containing protein [Umbelopsis sp. PMI_123]
MGLLSLGTPLKWSEAKQYADHVRSHGIEQFLSIYNKMKDKQKDCLLWGDEVEYIVISYDDDHKNAKISLRVFEMLAILQQDEQDWLKDPENHPAPATSWRPEYGRFMLEGTPGSPYGSSLKDLLLVEPNMKLRRQLAQKTMKPNEIPLTIVSYPRLGCLGEFLDPHHEPLGDSCRSLFVPDEIINPHARFPTLTANIRRRRGSKVAINMPIFKDTNTPSPFIDPTIPWDRDVFPEDKEAKEGAAKPDHIYMDAMAFGMGCCCLQITFQACNVEEARRLYDQLVPVGPIMLALTAAAPIYRGYLADVDCRWNVIASSVDDRTPEERGLKPLEHDRFVINKSRYDSVDSYISTDPMFKPKYNDINLVYDEKIYDKLRSSGIDDQLAKHVSHLFIRDPLVIFRELLDQDDTISSDHFENIQSTNWQTMRFKPPPPNSSIGWRVEFRSMEIQITDFENTAFAIFIVLLTRAILSFGLNFYIPISKVDENMKKAHKRGAVLNEKFYFRKNVFTKQQPLSRQPSPSSSTSTSSRKNDGDGLCDGNIDEGNEDELDAYEQMSIDEIINGKSGGFTGLIPMINSYLNSVNVDIETRCQLSRYLDLIKRRANGSLMTGATWMRQFVQNHPDYKHDSVVSQEINYDLMKTIEKISNGELEVPELLGEQHA